MKPYAILIFLLSGTLCSFSQLRIRIQVQDAVSRAALPKATVTLNKISFVTDTSGALVQLVNGSTVNLRVSYTGYTSFSLSFPARDTSIVVALIAKEQEGEEVIVVASSRTNSRIEDLPTKVEVLGAEEVNEENQIKPGNIASLLGDIAGVQIQQTNAATGNADMRIQGLPGKYTQILRDGMPLFGGYSGSFGILQVPPLDLQQIELVKGAASTLYGGGAIAGMVNLVSKKPRQGHPARSITINRSTLKENNLNMFFSGKDKKAGYTFFAGGTLQDAVDVNSDGFSDVPSVRSIFIHPRLFVYGKQKSSLALGYTLNYEDREGGDMMVVDGKADAQHRFFIRNKTLRNTGDVTWEYHLKNDALLTTKGSVSFSNRDITTNVFGMKASQLLWYSEVAYVQKTTSHNYVIGVNFNGDDFTKHLADSSFIPNESSVTNGVFLQDDWMLSQQFTLQGGLRIDHNSKWGNYILPRLSLLYRPSAKVTMRLGGGLGYKTPELFSSETDERAYKYFRSYRSDIRSEKSAGANFDVNYKTHTGDWALTINQTFYITSIRHPFDNEYNLVSNAYRYFNQTKPLQTVGAESYVQAIKDELELYFGYVYTDSRRKYDATHPVFPLVARHKLASIIAYEFSDHFRAGIESAFNGRQYLDNGNETPSYLFLAAMVRYNIGKVSLVLNGENLLDYRQSKKEATVFPPYTNPVFPEIWAPLDGRVINLSLQVKW
jgi:iron complex outermembrane receptor protein/outer membrane receptor for ferrienterochelin and colicins